MAIQKMSHRHTLGRSKRDRREGRWGPDETETAPLVCTWVNPTSWRQHRDLSNTQAVARGMCTWSKEHRFDAGGVEDANDRIPGPHPPAAHIPIGARQALCIQETFL